MHHSDMESSASDNLDRGKFRDHYTNEVSPKPLVDLEFS